MGMMEGILKGVGSAFKETKARMDEENQRQAMLESRVYEALLSSDYPEVQDLAIQGMAEIASGKGGKRKGLMGFLGKEQPSPILASMGDLFSGGKSVKPAGGAPTGETPAGVPFGEVGPPSAAMPPESSVQPGAQPPRGLYMPEAEKAGMMTEAQMNARVSVLKGLGASDEQVMSALTGQAAGRPEVKFQTIRDPESGKDFIVAVDDATGQIVEVVGEAPPGDRAPPRPISVSPGGTLVDPETGKPIFKAPPRPEKPGEDPRFTRAKRTQKALQSYQESGGLRLMGMKRPDLDKFVQDYGGFDDYDDYLSALAGGEGEAPPSGGFDVNQIPEQYRRFVDPGTGQPSQEADQRMQIIIEKLRAYKADPENNPPLDEHEVEFANIYQMLFLGGSSAP